MDLGILNTIIALVIVLLVLSLLVQAIQTFIKKLMKLKSRQIENTLKDLYEQAIGAGPPPASPTFMQRLEERWRRIQYKLKVLYSRATGAKAPLMLSSPAADQFKGKVLEQFKSIGRRTYWGNAVLDSLSKADLFKVIGKLESEDFFPDYAAKFQLLCDQINKLRKAIEDLTTNPILGGAASTRLAEIRSILAPIFNNVQTIMDGTQVKPRVLFADLLRLSKLDVHGVLKLLDEAQHAVSLEKEIASKADLNTELAQLQALSGELADVANMIGDLSQKFDDAVSPLRNKLEQIEIWFDTVTQSFDERYSRHMRTVSICISLVVVIVLNANFFRVYRSISTNEVQKNLIVENGPAVIESSRRRRSAEPPAPLATPSRVTGVFPSPTPGPSPVSIKDEIEQTRQEVDALSSTFQGFGFTPLSGQQVRSFLWSLGGLTALTRDDRGRRGWWGFTLARNEKGAVVNRANAAVPIDCQEVDKDGRPLLMDGKPINCTPAWRVQTSGEWWESLKNDVVVVLGWSIMVMMLSVGAPFWQDTLESLFGVKNILRQKSATQNIETQSGAGQPRE